MVQTDRHPRIIVAEIAVKKIDHALRQKTGFRMSLNKQQQRELIQNLNSAIQQLKYSFLPEEELASSTPAQEIQTMGEKLYQSVKASYHGRSEAGKTIKPTVHELTVVWGAKILRDLPRRLNEPFRPTIESGIDMQVVGLRNVSKDPMPGTNLYLTRVYNGEETFTVVTNIPHLKPGMRVGAAFLPPAEVGGEVSEAMFLGDHEYPEEVEYGTPIYDGAEFGEVRNILKQEFMKKSKK